jgi:hypothetical protein
MFATSSNRGNKFKQKLQPRRNSIGKKSTQRPSISYAALEQEIEKLQIRSQQDAIKGELNSNGVESIRRVTLNNNEIVDARNINLVLNHESDENLAAAIATHNENSKSFLKNFKQIDNNEKNSNFESKLNRIGRLDMMKIDLELTPNRSSTPEEKPELSSEQKVYLNNFELTLDK